MAADATAPVATAAAGGAGVSEADRRRARRAIVPGLEPLVISAPFGNYITAPGVTSTAGTFTVADRAGFLRWWLWWRIARTLRPMWAVGGWRNKLGLPNPGLPFLRRHGSWKLPGRLLSIHGFQAGEWDELLAWCRDGAPATMTGIELNVSCPNVGHLSVPADLFGKAVATGRPVVVKLPPVHWWETFRAAVAAGVRAFHCCNTLPSPAGGISGKPLKPVCLDAVKRIRDEAGGDGLLLIGGGGITTESDVADYRSAGADAFAVGTALLKPRYWLPFARRRLLARLAAAAAI